MGDTVISEIDKHLRLKALSDDEYDDETNEKKYEENYWQLSREIGVRYMNITFASPDISQWDHIVFHYLEQKILEDLTKRNVFDVDHSLIEGDHLTVCIDSWTLYFKYDGSKFIKSGFHYNSDLTVIAQGCLECSWNTEI
ncbi:hypothetical protein N9R24_01760 [Amylibacter sp.]|nr:hypothetical protein [Amylibacter sp.]